MKLKPIARGLALAGLLSTLILPAGDAANLLI